MATLNKTTSMKCLLLAAAFSLIIMSMFATSVLFHSPKVKVMISNEIRGQRSNELKRYLLSHKHWNVTLKEATPEEATQYIGAINGCVVQEASQGINNESLIKEATLRGTVKPINTTKEATSDSRAVEENSTEKKTTLESKTVARVSNENDATSDSEKVPGGMTEPILTVFTTFSSNEVKGHIFENTLRIWSLLKPLVHPILYCPDEECESRWSKSAEESGWVIHRAPRTSKHNIPLLRHMYLNAISRYATPFYAYANGDILFDATLTKTLRFLEKYAESRERLLVIGQRSNYKVQKGQELRSLSAVSRAAQESVLFTPWGVDYFIYTRQAVNWSQVPDIIVARRGYDNWLVRTALKSNVSVVDATATLLAVHQTGSGGNKESHHHGDPSYNMKILPKFDASLGLTTCAVMKTQYDVNGDVTLFSRDGCVKHYLRHHFRPRIIPGVTKFVPRPKSLPTIMTQKNKLTA